MFIIKNPFGEVFRLKIKVWTKLKVFGYRYISKYLQKRSVILIGYIVGWLTFWLIGHEFFIGTNFLPLIVIGLFLNGLSCVCHNVFATMYVKSELMDAALDHNINKYSVGGYFGGLKGSWNLLGGFLGPLISSYLYLKLDFELTWISLAIFQLAFFGVFYYMTIPEPKEQTIESYELWKLSA